jgi:hypothetical protein
VTLLVALPLPAAPSLAPASVPAVSTLAIPPRFRGPAQSANGGYTCGVVAELLGADAAEVTLRLPPPLETPLTVERDDAGVRVLHDGALVAEARPAQPEVDPPPQPPSFAEMDKLAAGQAADEDHPFPNCFVCGPARTPGDALRLTPTPLGDGRVAAPWRVEADFAAPRFVWAALDCPGAFAVMPDFSRGISVLGRLTARVDEGPRAGDECVVVGWPLGEDGRKLYAGTAVFRDGELLALARAVWIRVDRERADAA